MVYSSPAFLSEQIRKHLNGKDLIEYKIKRIILPTHTHPDDPWSYKIEFYILNYKIYDVMLWPGPYGHNPNLSTFIDKNGKFTSFVDKCPDDDCWVLLSPGVYLIHRHNVSNDSKYGMHSEDADASDGLDIYFTKEIFKQLLLDIHQLNCEAKLRIKTQ